MKWRSYRSSLSLIAFIALIRQPADPLSLRLSASFLFSLALVSYSTFRILIPFFFKILAFLSLSIRSFFFQLLLTSPSYAFYQLLSVLVVIFPYLLGGPNLPFHMPKVALKAFLRISSL